jgi:hypothetical protein
MRIDRCGAGAKHTRSAKYTERAAGEYVFFCGQQRNILNFGVMVAFKLKRRRSLFVDDQAY